jgi:Na+/H+ antiporter NhaD/arsenite permease-like protein
VRRHCWRSLHTFGDNTTLMVRQKGKRADNTDMVQNSFKQIERVEWDRLLFFFAVLTMAPQMSHGQWLLVTLTAGVGCSLLSISSSAGVALMSIAHEKFSLSSHLKWTWVMRRVLLRTWR